MRRNWALIALTAFLLGVVTFLTLHLHDEGIKAVLSQFHEGQLSYAKHLSNQIQFYLQARARGLRALSSFPSIQTGDRVQRRLDIEAYAKQIAEVYVKTISLYDESGSIVYATDPKAIGLEGIEGDLLAWAKREENRGKVTLAPVMAEPHSLMFILAIPLYRKASDSRHLKTGGILAGVLTFTLDMKAFLVNQLASADPEMSLEQIWIMDKKGTLLFQPNHPEMVFRNIYQREGECRSCHLSFAYSEEILAKRQGTVDYSLKNHPQKIAAFAPMEFEEVSWVVVVNTPYDRVTGFVKRSLRGHVFLIGIVVLAFAIGSALILRNERMKIRAEEELTHWQEKMEERKKAEEAVQRERDKLKGILDSMKDGVYIVNPQHEILYVNPVIEQERGPVSGRLCHEYFHDLPGACTWCRKEEVLAGKTVHWEWYSVKNGRTYDISETPVVGPDGTLCKLAIIRNITDRKKTEDALRQSEKSYRMLVETMSDGLGIQNQNGVWIYVNDRFCEMLGYSRDEMMGRPLTDFLSETDQRIYRSQMTLRRRGGRKLYEMSWLNKHGQLVPTLVSPTALFDEQGQFKGSFAVVTGITERKQAEEALKESEKQLRHLSSQLLTAQETERKRISRELHDELGQALLVVKLRFNFIEKNLSKNPSELRQECEDGLQYIDQVIENVRRLSRDLSPSILEDFGLSAALRWLINNFARSHTIKVALDMTDIDALIPGEAHVIVYRILQEALTNVGKHSQAKNVSIAIHKENSAVSISVEDDGIGFDTEKSLPGDPAEKGLGLETMQGRARMIGGTLDIRSEPGKGTRLTLRIRTT